MPEQPSSCHLAVPRTAELPPPETLVLADGYETAVYVHQPADSTLLPVVYLHGIQSHPGWFAGSAAALARRGHAVFQSARRGSGEARLARGHAQSAGQLLDDVQAACRLALERTGRRRLHLLGVSWGGKLAACYACHARRAVELASLTLVAPGIRPKVDLPLTTKLAVAVAMLVAPYRRFEIPLSDVELFTDNEPMRQYLRQDAHRLHRATARFLYASRMLDAMLRSVRAGSLDMPVSLILASRDRIIDNAATLRCLRRLAGERLSVRELEGCHTLEFEADPTPLYQALGEALDRAR